MLEWMKSFEFLNMYHILIHSHLELFNSISKCSGAMEDGIEIVGG